MKVNNYTYYKYNLLTKKSKGLFPLPPICFLVVLTLL
jgi:hypothetical protein